MRHHIGLYPQPGDEPRGYMGGSDGDIPVVELDPRAELAFHDLDAAVAYLQRLADEASALAARIRLTQAAAEVAPRRAPFAPGVSPADLDAWASDVVAEHLGGA